MIEILFICLIAWGFYAWRTGKFKKEYQDKNNAELKKAWTDLKENLKSTNPNSAMSDGIDNRNREQILSQKQRKLSLKKRENHAELLANKFATRTQIPEITISHQKLSTQNPIKQTTHHIYRYLIEYQDRHGNISERHINILVIHKLYNNNRWYFLADTDDGERTFKSERVICLTDHWHNRIYRNTTEIRNHLLSEYEVSEKDFYED